MVLLLAESRTREQDIPSERLSEEDEQERGIPVLWVLLFVFDARLLC